MDINALLAAASPLCVIIGLVISIFTFNNAVKERHAKTASEAAEIKAELKTLSGQIENLKALQDKSDDGLHSNDKRITILDQKVRSLEKRMENIEKEVRNGR